MVPLCPCSCHFLAFCLILTPHSPGPAPPPQGGAAPPPGPCSTLAGLVWESVQTPDSDL